MGTKERMSVEKYAAQQRMSIHAVLKMTMRGALESEVEEIEGKKITYILLDAAPEPEAAQPQPAPEAPDEAFDCKAAYEALKKEVEALKQKLEKNG